MSRFIRLPILGICLALAGLLAACDPKPTAAAPAANEGPTTASGTPVAATDSPKGIVPADSEKAAESPSTSPAQGATAIGGLSGAGSGSSSTSPAPATAGDGSSNAK